MLVVADNDVIGAVTALQRILESQEWAGYCELLEITFSSFAELGLPRDASDRTVWVTCQKADAVLVTANRAGGADSLDETVRQLATADSLPVITIADPQRLVRDRLHAEDCAIRLLDYLERVESLRGTNRIFIP
jgi:hypothetical protein